MEAKEEVKTIKLYRAVPNIGLTSHPGIGNSPEGIYNLAGYISKDSTRWDKSNTSSTICKKALEDGKFFYFFPHHAFYYPPRFTHLLHFWSLKILEYEFPIDVAFKCTGIGYYGYCEDEKPETYIYYSDMKGKVINSSSFNKEDKTRLLLESMMKGVNALRPFLNSNAAKDSDEVIAKHFIKNERGDSIKCYFENDYDLIEGKEHIRRNWDYTTAKAPIYEDPKQKNIEQLKNNGLDLTISDEAKEISLEFENAFINGKKEEAQTLILEYQKKFSR